MAQPIIYNAHFIQLVFAVEFEITSSHRDVFSFILIRFLFEFHPLFVQAESLDLNFQVSVNRKLLLLIPVRDFESAVKFGEERT